MQPFHFAGLDINTLTFAGLSRPVARWIAALSSFVILLMLTAFMLFLSFIPSAALKTAVLCFWLLVLIVYIFTGRFIIKDIAVLFAEHTPLSVLYRNDKRVIQRARSKLMDIADRVDFRRYCSYRKINPAIGSRSHLQVMAHQRKGDLRSWSASSDNLAAVADLVLQLHLAEKVIAADAKRKTGSCL